MLVLTRKPGERVLIGDDIVITVLETRGDGVRLGFEAPRGVLIQREEVVRAVSEANREAAAADDGAAAALAAALRPRAAAVEAPDPAASDPGV